MKIEKHWTFSAWNQESLYGWGTEEEAKKYTEHLNRNLEINHYQYDETEKELISKFENYERDDEFCLDEIVYDA